ncbi:polyamine aminopropyltransferase [Tahibacter amnicola]|uniref:Polyamine aminopropyltransferase n=1 Tax=Tahibacter amnicola TaxID=2976241 RepID=A0ABY6BKE4_9GAMM|nr:polyamine aminopropyltransferase [Tahibacter amnicola]UXI70239.1 polyamine aminopropyltransferase [Tahibacter amnicola]
MAPHRRPLSTPAIVLVFSVFIAASCGLAYELVIAALASYLLGDSLLQFSTVIGCYLFAMGIGSHLSRYIRDDRLLRSFVEVELLVGLIGGCSAALLFALFAAQSWAFRSLLYGLVFIVGLLVGMEIPLVTRLLNQQSDGERPALGDLVSRVLTFDYLGALAVSLLFPLILAPWLGLVRTAFLFGLLNAVVAAYTLFVLRRQLAQAGGLWLRIAGVLAVLGVGMAMAPRLTEWAENRAYGGTVVHGAQSPYQRVVLTRWQDDLRLYLNGDLQFSSRDEYRYHEALVHPAMSLRPGTRSVLILGGGDGLAAREVLKYPEVQSVTLVDLDAEVTDLFATLPELVSLNQGALADRRLRVINDDAIHWLEQSSNTFDVAIVDFPDPTTFATGKLYSVPFYRLLSRHLAADGVVAVQASSPFYVPHAFWCIDTTLREAGWHTLPYHAYVPSFGEWGYVLASHDAAMRPPTQFAVRTRFLDTATAAAMFVFPPDMAPRPVQPNRLDDLALVRYFEKDWLRVAPD